MYEYILETSQQHTPSLYNVNPDLESNYLEDLTDQRVQHTKYLKLC